MVTPAMGELIKQLFKKPATNPFPVKYAPKSVRAVLELVAKGQIQINPPVELPDKFRGKILIDKDTECINCNLCQTVCPAKALTTDRETETITIDLGKCIFCAQCVDICPTERLSSSEDFLLAGFDRKADSYKTTG